MTSVEKKEGRLLGFKTFYLARSPLRIGISDRFKRLRSLHHPNLVRIYDVVPGKQNKLTLVGEHFPQTLREKIKSAGTNSFHSGGKNESELFKWAAQILSALLYLHTNNECAITHRCLSLDNVLVSDSGDIKLSLDFAVDHLTNHSDDASFVLGQLSNVAPEIIMRRKGDVNHNFKSDVWGFGILLLQLSGGLPLEMEDCPFYDALKPVAKESAGDDLLSFDDHDVDPIYNAWLADKIEKIRGNTTGGYREIVFHCLQWSPGERPDCSELWDHPEVQNWREKVRPNKLWAIKPAFKILHLDVEKMIEEMNALDDDLMDMEIFTESSDKLLEQIDRDLDDMLEDGEKQDLFDDWFFEHMTLKESEAFLRKHSRDTLLVRRRESAGRHLGYVLSVYDKNSDKVTHHNLTYVNEPGHTGFCFISNRDKLYATLDQLVQHSSECSTFHYPDGQIIEESGMKGKRNHREVNVEAESVDELEELYKGWKSIGYGNLDKRISRLLLFTNKAQTFGCSIDRIPTTVVRPAQQKVLPLDPKFMFMKDMVSIHPSIFETSTKNYDPSFDFMRNYSVIYREKSIHYQRYRSSVFKELLSDYPVTQQEITKEAKIDIPPIVRGHVWAAILGVPVDTKSIFNSYDYISEGPADKQIDLDIPRCHQYNKRMASPKAREGLKTILKCWVAKYDGELVYWQGLDSVLAPFLLLHMDDWAKAFCSMDLFVHKYLRGFFTQDNMSHLQETLLIFSQLTAYHDPELAYHLNHIGFYPDLYAVSWYLTLFSHFLHLDKIFNCWDILLVSPFSLIHFMAVAIMKQLRKDILSVDFNNCIFLFSNLPAINIQKAIEDSVSMFNCTPPSLAEVKYYLERGNGDYNVRDLNLTIEVLKTELAPRMSLGDLKENSKLVTAIDIRPKQEFEREHLPDVNHINVYTEEGTLDITRFDQYRGTHIVIIGSPDPSSQYYGPTMANRLVQGLFPFVSSLHGGFPFQ
ncbi:TBC domain-containing protein kinase-like protein-like [Planoprotostelium fungivorum]|uniref:TBC domain-containing protein kinase-like protein-like n=1 Tax=Planoprotostelium fungivorum TaxID=1890364 RepID=A0A2P6NI88_9EUKA|nr:TBC domain-containing protein kinase-like protein-like [Planoprotostelium fungivorum]